MSVCHIHNLKGKTRNMSIYHKYIYIYVLLPHIHMSFYHILSWFVVLVAPISPTDILVQSRRLMSSVMSLNNTEKISTGNISFIISILIPWQVDDEMMELRGLGGIYLEEIKMFPGSTRFEDISME